MKTCVVMVVTWLAAWNAAWGQANGKLQIHFMDVGQGDGAVLISPGGEVVLFDDGAKGDCEKPMAYLRHLNLTKIDYHILSHYHADHFGCCGEVLTEFPLQKEAIDRGGSYGSKAFEKYVAAVGTHRKTATKGMKVELDKGSPHPVTIEVVALNGNGIDTDNENDLSLDCLVQYGGFRAEIGGDLSGYDQSNYLDIETSVAPLVGELDVYKVHHHGSVYSTNETWLAYTRPTIGIISCGTGNTFGHPTENCLEALHDAGVKKTYWTEAGAGAKPEEGLDVVGGNILVEVADNTPSYTVTYGGGKVDTYQVKHPNQPPGPFVVAQAALPARVRAAVALAAEGGKKGAKPRGGGTTKAGPGPGARAAPVEVYMKDGQLISHLIRVYTTEDIPSSEAVTLSLHQTGSLLSRKVSICEDLPPVAVSRNVSWVRPPTEDEASLQKMPSVARTGTLLLFDVCSKVSLRESMRPFDVTPILKWRRSEDPKEDRWPQDGSTIVVGTSEVGLASVTFIAAVVGAFLAGCIGLLGWASLGWSRRVPSAQRLGFFDAFFAFAKEKDHRTGEYHFSMWAVQLLIWTLTISAMVLAVSFINSGSVAIPEQLLVLMGCSLVTTGLAASQAAEAPKTAGFLYVYEKKDDDEQDGGGRIEPVFSIAKAQILIWTLLTVLVFVYKSWEDGELWPVPWVLVGLMGFSQAGYVATKFNKPGRKPATNDAREAAAGTAPAKPAPAAPKKRAGRKAGKPGEAEEPGQPGNDEPGA